MFWMLGCVTQPLIGERPPPPVPVGLDEVSSLGFSPNELVEDFRTHQSRWEVAWRHLEPDVLLFEPGTIYEAYETGYVGHRSLFVRFELAIEAEDGTFSSQGEAFLRAHELEPVALSFEHDLTWSDPDLQALLDEKAAGEDVHGLDLESDGGQLTIVASVGYPVLQQVLTETPCGPAVGGDCDIVMGPPPR